MKTHGAHGGRCFQTRLNSVSAQVRMYQLPPSPRRWFTTPAPTTKTQLFVLKINPYCARTLSLGETKTSLPTTSETDSHKSLFHRLCHHLSQYLSSREKKHPLTSSHEASDGAALWGSRTPCLPPGISHSFCSEHPSPSLPGVNKHLPAQAVIWPITGCKVIPG